MCRIVQSKYNGYIQALISWGVHEGKAHFYVHEIMQGEPDCLKQPIRTWSQKDWKLKLLRAKIRKEVSKTWRLHIDLQRCQNDKMLAR